MRVGLLLLALSSPAFAGTYDIHAGDDLFGRLSMLQAGDTVTVHAGTYTTPGFYQVTWTGTQAQPIVIQAAPGDHVTIMGDPSQNVININGSYFTLDGFEITGGSHGLRLMAVDHATLSNLTLHGLGDVGISCNFEPDNCDSVTIRHNEIFDTGHAGTGEGMYLGCNDAACLFTNSIVEDNYVHDLGGMQGDGIEIKTGAYGNVVRDNVIVRSQYPGITMYGFAGSGAPNIVERNLVWHTTLDNGIQVVGQIIVRNNIVIDAAANGIQSKPSQNFTPHDVTIINNTIVSAAAVCLKTNNWSTETNQIVANNAIYCDGGAAVDINGGAAPGAIFAANIGLGTSDAPAGFAAGTTVAADLGDPTTGKVYPPLGSPLIDAGDPAHAAIDDFNGTPRDSKPDVGAYEHTTPTNPGWIVGEGFKTPPPLMGGDGGTTGGDDAGGSSHPGHSGCGCQTNDPGSLAALAAVLAGYLRRPRRRRRT